MNISKIKDKTKLWVEAGIINDSQAQKIFEFEGQTAGRSWGVFGFSIVGLLAIIVGIVSLIAANWAEISDGLKLTCYFLMQGGLGAACVQYRERRGLSEGLQLAFALLLFGGIGLIGQIYHLESDGLSALRFWLVLSAPLALTSVQYLLPRIWFVVFGWALMLWFGDRYDAAALHGRASELVEWNRGMVLLTIVFGTIALGVLQRFQRVMPFMHSARAFGWLVFMGFLAPATNVFWAIGERRIELPFAPVLLPTIAFTVACLLLLKSAASRNEGLAAKLMVLTLAFGFVTFLVPCFYQVGKSDVLGGLIFILDFSFAAMAAALLGAKGLFDLLTFVLATRFVVAYFEVFGTLTLTGVGLIISGLVILGAVLLWSKFRRQIGRSLGVEL